MKSHLIIHILTLLPLIFADETPGVTPHFIDSSEVPHQPLCDAGCKCSETGNSLLDCSRAGIAKLPASLFISHAVQVVNLQSNYINHIPMNTFANADSVEELDFSENRITRIDNFTFVPLRSLVLLRLSHNRLTDVTQGMLEGLADLRILELGHNHIQRVWPEVFQATPLLQELRIQFNPLFDLSENLFQHLPKLEKLDLQDTGLVVLPDRLFAPSPRLQWLSLASNAFEKVPEEALAHAHALESLDLSGNDFMSLAKGDFRRLSSLSLLYLNNLSRLRRIERDALVGLESLDTLSCSYNPKLEYVDPEAFGSVNSTETKTPPHEQLYMRQNALRTLKSPLDMEKWSTLNFVDFADNPWDCDCKLLWMRELKPETQSNIVCDSPLHLRGRPFNTVHATELKCEDKWAITYFILTISTMVLFGVLVLTTSAVVCSRTRVGLYIRAKKQFSYAKVAPKTEVLDLEWDPSGEI